MGLVGVAEVGGEGGPVDRAGDLRAGQGLVDPVAQDDPLRADADVRGEEPLQGPYGHPLGACEVADVPDGAVAPDAVHQGHGEVGLGIRARTEAQEERVERGHACVLVGGVEDGGDRGGVHRGKHRVERDPLARE